MKANETGYKCSSCNHGVEYSIDIGNDNGDATNIYKCVNTRCDLYGKIQMVAEEPNQ